MLSYHVLIPAYNAEKTISILLKQLQDLPQKPVGILVVDDGSQDSTCEMALAGKALVHKFSKNYGKGRALRQGFDMLLDNHDAEYIMCMDADLQHPVSSIPDLLREAETRHSRFVIGVRHRLWSTMPWMRRLSNFITSAFLSVLTGQKIRDSQCGFRLIAKNVLREISLQQNGFQLESEMLLQIAANKIRIDQVMIPTIYNNTGSHIRHLADTFEFIRLIMKEVGQRLRCSLKNKKQT